MTARRPISVGMTIPPSAWLPQRYFGVAGGVPDARGGLPTPRTATRKIALVDDWDMIPERARLHAADLAFRDLFAELRAAGRGTGCFGLSTQSNEYQRDASRLHLPLPMPTKSWSWCSAGFARPWRWPTLPCKPGADIDHGPHPRGSIGVSAPTGTPATAAWLKATPRNFSAEISVKVLAYPANTLRTCRASANAVLVLY